MPIRKNIFPLFFIALILAMVSACQKDYNNPNLVGGNVVFQPTSVYINYIAFTNIPEINDVTGLPYDSTYSTDTSSTDTIFADPFFKITDADNTPAVFDTTQPSHYADMRSTDGATYNFTSPFQLTGLGKHIHLALEDFDSTTFSQNDPPVTYSEFIDSLFITLPNPGLVTHNDTLLQLTTPKGIPVWIGLLYR